jgi:hypothetical protein
MPRTIRQRIRESDPEAVAPEVTPEPKSQQKITVTAKKAFFLGTAIVDVGHTAEVNQFQFEKLTEKGLV